MNEVEKMYRNVLGYVCNMPDIDCFHECEKCDSYITFTAEKQIELIKWLARKEMLCRLEDEYSYFERFEECIAYIINYLWQDLTEEEKQQMKKILE